jgi:uncharacterized protein (DUF58 family)
VAVVLLIIGVHRRINLLMLLGDLLLVMLLLNLLAAGRTLRGLQVRRRFDDWLFARTPCFEEVQVSNPDRQPRLGLCIHEQGADQSAPCRVDSLAAQDCISWRRQVILPRRGRYTWGTVEASTGYPFGLVERRRLLMVEETVTVLPCLGWLHRGRFLRHLRDLTVQPREGHFRQKPRPDPAAQAEFHGLRSYRSGDSPRLIHWRTSARRGELMVREFEDEPSDNLLVVVDPTLPAEWENGQTSVRDEFEDMVSLVASICWEWCRRRDDRLLFATATAEPVILDGLTGPAHARQILECLALLEGGARPTNPAVIKRLQARCLPTATFVVVALGSSTLAEPLRHTLRRRVHCLDASHTDRCDFYTPPEYASRTTSPHKPEGLAAGASTRR